MDATADALEKLVGQAAWLRRLAFALVRDRDAAEDVVQGAFIAAWKHPPATTGDGDDLKPWLRQVARRNAQDQRRGDQRLRAREAEAVALDAPVAAGPEQLLGDLEIHRAVAEAVSALEDPYREVVVLRYFEGQTAAEVARRLDVPGGTVRWRLKEGLERVRVALDARFGGDCRRWVAALAPMLPRLAPPATAAAPAAASSAAPAAALPAVSARSLSLPALVGAGVGLAAAVVLMGLMLLPRLRSPVAAGDPATGSAAQAQAPMSTSTSAGAPAPGTRRGSRAGGPPRFSVSAPGDLPERLEGVASDPEVILRRMLAAVEKNAYEDFLHASADVFKATLTLNDWNSVARQLGPRLARGYSAQSFGRLARRQGVHYLWKLTLADGGDDVLVRLAVVNDQIAGFTIE
jgi:RNA polymerase sigma factor (sigma-70 family)